MAQVLMAPPLESLLTNPNPDLPRPKSLLSRFSSPLSKHARNMFDLAIEPEDPFKIYSPGELVRGHIVLTVLKGFDITHLVVALHGYAKVYKHQVALGEVPAIDETVLNSKGNRGFEYHGTGLASLFQEEQVLCGQGFLKKQVYKFVFEMRFPAKSLPSTIDFERGTITYMISATLTRPTTIAPTTTRHKKIKFQDCLDIESMYTPKSRVISLEPVSRRGKVRKIRQTASEGTQDSFSKGTLTRNTTQSSNPTSAQIPIGRPPLSPAPSENTVSTTTTASSQSFQERERGSPNRKSSRQNSDGRSSTTSTSAHTITATSELPRHGALPGDMIPVRVMVTHTKPNIRGVVIATLYRQGRVDMHPAIPLATRKKDKQAEYEDVYPRSKTGLGGLYFANSSPSSEFRKDLSQSSTMMIINPQTLTADITTSVKVPDTAFPTIATVPGGMISFTYHIEVVIDLFGRLGETRLLPRLTSSEPTFTHTHEGGNQMASEWTNNVLDTSQLRRTKSVVCFEMSVVVGTKDSGRQAKKARQFDNRHAGTDEGYDGQEWAQNTDYQDEYGYSYGYDQSGYPQHYDGHYGSGSYDGYNAYDEYYQQDQQPDYYPPPTNILPPPEAEEEVDEKTRLRRQEQLLLPSQPPQEGESSSSSAALVPTAPLILDGPQHERIVDMGDVDVDIPVTPSPAESVTSARSADTIRPYSTSPPPVVFDSDHRPTDDKQELERQRLLAQASAPPTDDSGEGSSGHPTVPLASAPDITDDDYNTQTLHQYHEGSELPQYER